LKPASWAAEDLQEFPNFSLTNSPNSIDDDGKDENRDETLEFSGMKPTETIK
jgi:hypothetical protein